MSENHEVAIIGGGLFGSIVGAWLHWHHIDTVTIDAGLKNAGSKPAACLMKPSWLNAFSKEDQRKNLDLLGTVYKSLTTIDFKVGPAKVAVHWVDPAEVLNTRSWCRVKGKVTNVRPLNPGWELTVEGFEEPTLANNLVVAAGVWANEVLPLQHRIDGLQPRWGAAALWPDHRCEPFISPWAPYRQLVGFNRGDGLWVGDGTAVKTWDCRREAEVIARCSRAVGREMDQPQVLVGQRPYVKDAGGPAYCRLIGESLYVINGGAKNGTMAAAWCARFIGGQLGI
jgi:glycine/D-amino acid oxidase-like deaminating enzyme